MRELKGLPSQFLMGKDIDQQTPTGRVYVLHLRAPEGIFYYLAELARIAAGVSPQPGDGRALLIHVSDYPPQCAAVGGKGCEEPVKMPLFVTFAADNHDACSSSSVSARLGDGSSWFIPGDPDAVDVGPVDPSFRALNMRDARHLCHAGRSMMAMELISELIGLQKSAQSISTTGTVKVLGQ